MKKNEKKIRSSFADVISEPIRTVSGYLSKEELANMKYEDVQSVVNNIDPSGLRSMNVEVKRSKKSDRYKGLSVLDFSIDGLQVNGGIANLKANFMTGVTPIDNQNAIDSLCDSIISDLEGNDNNNKNIDDK